MHNEIQGGDILYMYTADQDLQRNQKFKQDPGTKKSRFSQGMYCLRTPVRINSLVKIGTPFAVILLQMGQSSSHEMI